MIQAWRVCRAPFADLLGEGARHYGGRWNSPGLLVVYLAEHPALAVLEVRVHLDVPLDLLPNDYVLMRVELPTQPPEVVADLPADPRAFGDEWLRSGRTAVLQVPSVVTPMASNLLLNPRHPAAGTARVAPPQPFRFDARLWTT